MNERSRREIQEEILGALARAPKRFETGFTATQVKMEQEITRVSTLPPHDAFADLRLFGKQLQEAAAKNELLLVFREGDHTPAFSFYHLGGRVARFDAHTDDSGAYLSNGSYVAHALGEGLKTLDEITHVGPPMIGPITSPKLDFTVAAEGKRKFLVIRNGMPIPLEELMREKFALVDVDPDAFPARHDMSYPPYGNSHVPLRLLYQVLSNAPKAVFFGEYWLEHDHKGNALRLMKKIARQAIQAHAKKR